MISGIMKNALINGLEKYPVFSIKDIAGVLNKKISYAYLVAFRLKKQGLLMEIEKGKYSLEDDPFLVASWIAWPSYISCWAALNYYKLTDQLPFTIHIITTRKRKNTNLAYGNAKIKFIKINQSAFFGFQKVLYQGKEIFIAEKEKALIDGIVAKKMSLNEALEIIQNNKNKLNRKKIFFYAKISKGLEKKLKEGLNA